MWFRFIGSLKFTSKDHPLPIHSLIALVLICSRYRDNKCNRSRAFDSRSLEGGDRKIYNRMLDWAGYSTGITRKTWKLWDKNKKFLWGAYPHWWRDSVLFGWQWSVHLPLVVVVPLTSRPWKDGGCDSKGYYLYSTLEDFQMFKFSSCTESCINFYKIGGFFWQGDGDVFVGVDDRLFWCARL